MVLNRLYALPFASLITLLLALSTPLTWADTANSDKTMVSSLSEDESVEDIETSEPRHPQGGVKDAPEDEPGDEAKSPSPPPPVTDTAEGQASPEAANTATGSSGSESGSKVIAPNVDLKKEVTSAPEPVPSPAAGETPITNQTNQPEERLDEPDSPTSSPGHGTIRPDASVSKVPDTPRPAPVIPPPVAENFTLLNAEVMPGTSTRLAWSPGIQIAGLSQPTPVLVVNGAQPGPVLCLTGAVHGDELNGIEIVRRIMYDLDPKKLSGTVVGIPIVNVQGFQQGSRYLADRRDLNRYFPGDPAGSLAGRIAHSLFEQVIRHCTLLVDVHTGSLKRTNLPQMRADMNDPEVAEFTRGFDGMAIVHSSGGPGMLRTAATKAGIVTVTMEAGESLRIQEHQIKAGVNSIHSLMEKQNMLSRFFVWGDPEPVYYDSHWIRVDQGGILFSDVDLGDKIVDGQILGIVADPITNVQIPVRADADGRVIGMAVDQVVMAGFAAYHVGLKAETPGEE
ncbi:succinylglutamate desuccinylase/aspartoacylase family protein [Marinobacter caseinilyticus]|uniref:succinylglutamate desuccinylase/aspartoacylase family protein n=1 Tax=Marinobacter caseinilyticus TaxID=2692195 RepID=UPI00140D48F0|nr:succinylglutamate desuccinylase/aspartoacylase family protein [Marinobacter caseinilyticus]